MTLQEARKVIGLNIHNLNGSMQMAVATIMDAVEAIRRFGLVEAITDKGDKIYDTPDGSFKLKYGGETLIDDRLML